MLSRVQLFATPMCSPPGSSVHGIFQARIPEWVAISFSQGSFPPRSLTPSRVPRIGLQILDHLALILAICGAQAFHCSGFSCRGARTLGPAGFSNCSSQTQEHRFSNCGPRTCWSSAFWSSQIRDWTPVAGEFLTTEPRGKPENTILTFYIYEQTIQLDELFYLEERRSSV